jgi:EAL domain-containing protein (putative c-di-GMP-specific phosphodiesterase class I)
LVKITHGLGREVIACGAETADMVASLPKVGIELAEGHQLGRPTAAIAPVNGTDEPLEKAAGRKKSKKNKEEVAAVS